MKTKLRQIPAATVAAALSISNFASGLSETGIHILAGTESSWYIWSQASRHLHGRRCPIPRLPAGPRALQGSPSSSASAPAKRFKVCMTSLRESLQTHEPSVRISELGIASRTPFSPPAWLRRHINPPAASPSPPRGHMDEGSESIPFVSPDPEACHWIVTRTDCLCSRKAAFSAEGHAHISSKSYKQGARCKERDNASSFLYKLYPSITNNQPQIREPAPSGALSTSAARRPPVARHGTRTPARSRLYQCRCLRTP